MIVTKSQITEAIEEQKRSITDWAKRESQEALAFRVANDMVPCVFKMQRSPHRWMVRWNLTKQGTEVGSIQKTAHAEPYNSIEIMWVAS